MGGDALLGLRLLVFHFELLVEGTQSLKPLIFLPDYKLLPLRLPDMV